MTPVSVNHQLVLSSYYTSPRFRVPGQDWDMTRAEVAQFLARVRYVFSQGLTFSPPRPIGGNGILVPYIRASEDRRGLQRGYVCVQYEDAPYFTAWVSNWQAWAATQVARLWFWRNQPVSVPAMSQAAFLAHIEEMRGGGRGRGVEDPHFSDWMASDFLKEGVWDLPKLQAQIAKDLHRCDIRLNDQRMLEFSGLCVRMGLNPALFEQKKEAAELSNEENEALRFMAMLHQGACAASLIDASRYFDGNAAGLIVTQLTDTPARDRSGRIVRYPTRIRATYDKERQYLIAEQDLALRDPRQEIESYPIRGRVRWTSGCPAIVFWQFVC